MKIGIGCGTATPLEGDQALDTGDGIDASTTNGNYIGMIGISSAAR